MNFIKAIVAAGLVAAATSAFAADITGAGATFPFPVYSKWADAYKKETGNGLNYQSIGSGAGIKQIQAKTVTFGATDAPLKAEVLEKDGLVQWPMVMGGIVAVVNLDGVKPGDLVIDGPTLAKIFLGDIKSWDDAAIAKLNPNVKLSKQAIAVVHRSDGSGTSFVFTTTTMAPITCGHCARPSLVSSSAFKGASLAPKVTVLAWICLMPAPEPIDW